jgi:hypothetical protein
MKSKHVLPIPFLILILAGVVSLFSILAEGRSGTRMAGDDSLRIQTVEQERVAALYFRVLSWLTEITSPKAPAAKSQSQPTPAQAGVRSASSPTCQSKTELCTFRSVRKLVVSHRHPSLD